MSSTSKLNNYYQKIYGKSLPAINYKKIGDNFIAEFLMDGVIIKSDPLQSKKDARNNLSKKSLLFLKETPGIEENISIIEIIENYWCNKEKYNKLLKILCIEGQENNKKLKHMLMTACTHQTASKYGILTKTGNGQDYENLEFFGDRILNYIVAEFYYKKYKNSKIDVIQEIYSQKIENSYIKKVICNLGIDKYLIHDCVKLEFCNKILADVGEALIGAIHEELGMESAKKFIYKHFNLDEVHGIYGKFEKLYKKL